MKKKIKIIGIEIVIIFLVILFANSSYIELIPKCWIYENSGILCPSCGGTRFIVNLLQGKVLEAFMSHSVFFIGLLYILILNIIYIINIDREKKIGKWIYPKSWHIIVFIIILVIYTIIRNLL